MEQPAWMVYNDDKVLEMKYTYAGGYQAFKNHMQQAKASGRPTDKLRLMQGTLPNIGGIHILYLIRNTEKQILPWTYLKQI